MIAKCKLARLFQILIVLWMTLMPWVFIPLSGNIAKSVVLIIGMAIFTLLVWAVVFVLIVRCDQKKKSGGKTICF